MGAESEMIKGIIFTGFDSSRMATSVIENVLQKSPQQRRDKRLVPDNDKDDRYWEKRKRNNIAARKSREHKRQMESVIRSRAHYLEEENALLKKELIVLKERMGLPPDECILSESEKEICLKQHWDCQTKSISNWAQHPNAKTDASSNDSQINSADKFDPSRDTPSVSSTSSIENDRTQFCYILTDNSQSQKSSHQQVKPYDLSPNGFNGAKGTYSDDPRDIVNQSEYYKNRRSFEEDREHMIPADLSVRKRRSEDFGTSYPETIKRLFPSYKERSTGSSNADDLEFVDLSGNAELRTKLELLSEQVAKMQKTFNVGQV